MKNHKFENKVVYEGLGFPIILRNVPMINLRGIWTLDINLNTLQKVVLLSLAHRSLDLTGNQIRFIRYWLGLTQAQFGRLFGVTHSAIVKWEKAENESSKINLTTQRDIRLWILDQLLTKDADFRKAFKIIHMADYTQPKQPLEFDVPTDLVAI